MTAAQFRRFCERIEAPLEPAAPLPSWRWSSLSMHMSAMFCFVFAILAALSEYIGRLLGESTGRPLYYVAGEHTSSVLIADSERKNVVTDSMGEFAPEAGPLPRAGGR